MGDEIVDIVDKSGSIIGQSKRKDVYRSGLLHPAVNIIIVNSSGQLFIQQRAKNKSAYPLYWDISVSEHLKTGEGYYDAAIRGIREELSITSTLKLLRDIHIQRSEYVKNSKLIKEYELVRLYGTVYDGRVDIDPAEVAAGKFISLKNLKELLDNNKIQFTPWGLDEIEFISDNPTILN